MSGPRSMVSAAISTTTGQVAVAIGCLALATVAVEVLLDGFGIENAGIVYVVAVAITAVVAGTPGALAASVGAFLLYDFFFVDPRFTLTIRQPEEWLNVLLLMFVAILVGQLAAIQRQQTHTAREREDEARAMFRFSRALATRTSTAAVLSGIVERVVADTAATRSWIEIADASGVDRAVADSEPGRPRPTSKVVHVLRRTEGDAPAEWTRVHAAAKPGARAAATSRTTSSSRCSWRRAGGASGRCGPWSRVRAGCPGRRTRACSRPSPTSSRRPWSRTASPARRARRTSRARAIA